jgi:hypothetical protein
MKMDSKSWTMSVVGFAVMAVVGWNFGGDGGEGDGVSASPARVERERPQASRGNRGTSAAAAAAMQRLRQAGNPEERMRATIELVNSLSISELAAWMDGGWFDLREGFDLTLFTKIAMERWRLEDPEGMLNWSLKGKTDEAQEILAGWAEREPGRVIDYFRNHPNDALEMVALSSIAKVDPGLALERLREMNEAGISKEAMGDCDQLMAELAKSSPEGLDAMLDGMPDAMRDSAETALVGERLKVSFAEEVKQLMAMSDGWKLFQGAMARLDLSAEVVIAELANFPPLWRSEFVNDPRGLILRKDPKAWLEADLTSAGFSEDQVNRIRSVALESLVLSDPKAALGFLDGLNESVRGGMIQRAFYSSGSNVDRMAELMAMLTTDGDRVAAQEFLDSRTKNAEPAPVSGPDDWLQRASGSDVNGYYLTQALASWSPEQLNDLKVKFVHLPAEQKAAVALTMINAGRYGNGLSKDLQAEAFRYLSANPETASGLPQDPFAPQTSSSMDFSVSQFAVGWMQEDPKAAGAWVNTLPVGDTRLTAQKNLAANWAQYDPQAMRQWMEALPSQEKTAVEEFLRK